LRLVDDERADELLRKIASEELATEHADRRME
jgi:hypothetical protein